MAAKTTQQTEAPAPSTPAVPAISDNPEAGRVTTTLRSERGEQVIMFGVPMWVKS